MSDQFNQAEMFPAEVAEASKKLKALIEAGVKESYRSEIKRFIGFTEKHGLTIDSVLSYCQGIKESGQAVRTINKHLSAVKDAVRSLFKGGYITESQRFQLEGALSEIKLLKVSKNQNVIEADQILSLEDINTLIEKASTRLSLIIRFLADTGSRIMETCTVELSDCNTENGKTRIQLIGKGGKARTVKINTALFKAIRQTYKGGKYLFETVHGNPVHDRNVYTDLRRTAEKHIGRAVNPHMLRHSFATHMIQKTGKIKAVSEYLGHGSTAITLDMYLHESLNDDDLELIAAENPPEPFKTAPN